MSDLFEETAGVLPRDAPLAARMRPAGLSEFAGQEHILGEGKLLRRLIEADRVSSLILFGPPGTGKTSLARVIARSTSACFQELSGVEHGTGDLRKAIEAAAMRQRSSSQRTILFLDEIHRLNKAQQDVLLPHVEQGTIRLIGATTHNPFFSVNGPLISRSQIFQLEPLQVETLRILMRRAVADAQRGLGNLQVLLDEDAETHLATIADGDARRCLNALEIAARSTPPDPDGRIRIGLTEAEESIQQKAIVYDRDGDDHYDTISAFIKSMRGSDPDAALYWLAKMLHAGEDIRFIARRIVICASEDVGMADSQALVVATAALQAVEFVGLPEARIPLAHAAVYIATAPKSNRAYAGLNAAARDVREGVTLAVPRHLRCTAYSGSKQLGHGVGYAYSHDAEGGYIPQAYLTEGRTYYEPTENGMEKRVKERLDFWRAQFEASTNSPTAASA